jgi:acyl dehydratase
VNTPTATVTLDAVQSGQALPELRHEVTATTVVLGALAARDWRPMHHDHSFAVHRNGLRNIFLSTPNQAAWLERYLTDWTGPKGRLGRLQFRMKASVFAGDTMVIAGTVRAVEVDDQGCGWATVDVTMTVDGTVCTECRAKVALPRSAADNPWQRRGDQWRP